MTTATDYQLTLSNFRVEYHAPDHSKGHVFEPYCAILADAAEFDGREVRVFDVPDPDESQRVVAQFACDAMNGYSKLRKVTESVSQRLSALPDYLKNNDSKVLSEIVDECLDDLINASRSTK